MDRSTKVEQILDIAHDLFRQNGYTGTTIASVARAAGVAQAAVYWYFPSKDHLFVGVLERMLDSLVADLAKRRRRSLVDQILYAVDRLAETQDLGAGLHERARESEVATAFQHRMRATLRATLLAALARHAPSGDYEMLADSILALADGTHGLARAPRRRLLTFALGRLLGVQPSQ